MTLAVTTATAARPDPPPADPAMPTPVPAFTLADLAAITVPTAATTGDAARGVMTPVIVIAISVAAAIGTSLLLPGRKGVAWRRLGGSLLAAALVSIAIVILLSTGVASANVYFWAFAAIAIGGSVRVITHPQPVYSALYFVLTVFASAGLFVIAYAEFMAVALITIYAGAILVTYTFVIMLAADAAPAETGVGGKEKAAKDFIAAHDANARSPVVASIVGFVTAGMLLFAIFERAPEQLDKRLSLTDARFLARGDAALDEAEEEAGILLEDDASQVAVAAPLTPADGPIRGDLYTYQDRLAYAQEDNVGAVQVLGVYLFTRQMVALQVAGLVLTVAMIGAIVIARRRILPGNADDEAAGHETMTMPFTPVNDNPKSLPVHGTKSPRQKAYPQN